MKNASHQSPVSPADLRPLLPGFYERVAQELGCETSYVMRAARGECASQAAEAAMERELRRMVRMVKNA